MIIGHIIRQRLNLCDSHVVADTIDYLEAKFLFKTDDWDGLDKWAHFANGDAVYDIPLTDDCIRKEDHLNLSAGMWKVCLHGNEFRDGEVVQRITTDEAVLYVSPTGTLDGEPFPEIPASETERINARLEALEQDGTGKPGEPGFSPSASVEQTDTGAVITITDKDGTTTATVTNGKDGQPGEKGEKGEPGEPGAQGEKGEKGDTGAKGDPGEQGIPGEKGDQGEPGEKGADGEDGLAIYAYNKNLSDHSGPKPPDGTYDAQGIVSRGTRTLQVGDLLIDFVGNVYRVTVVYPAVDSFDAVYVTNIRGESGSDGSDGEDGTSVTVVSVSESAEDGGSNVVTFSDGKTLTVKNGSKGADGPQGPQGETGPQGPQGETGPQGPQGETGPQGPQGETGPQGAAGATASEVIAALPKETWTFTLADGSEIEKEVPLL